MPAIDRSLSLIAGHPFYTHEELAFDARDAGWWGNVEAEHEAAREGVALFDLSSFGKLHVSGAGAEAAMEWCSSSEVGNERRFSRIDSSFCTSLTDTNDGRSAMPLRGRSSTRRC